MLWKKLRSVVAQLVRGRKSVASRRNFCSTANSTNGNFKEVSVAAGNSAIETPRLAAVCYLAFGYMGFAIWEIIRLKEYGRTCLRVVKEEAAQREVARGSNIEFRRRRS